MKKLSREEMQSIKGGTAASGWSWWDCTPVGGGTDVLCWGTNPAEMCGYEICIQGGTCFSPIGCQS